MPTNIDWKWMFTTYEGRIERGRWWIGVAVLLVVALISTILFGTDGLVAFIITIVLQLAGLMLHIKRCHDRDKSGWWCLLLLIPFVGFLWALVDLGLLEGTPGTNRFGPDPLAREKI
ncbi:DUF805 domain-containing protein [Salinarimonas ramus]|uniref:DUF805 domain-containing protein n=1 Tax=Salinarimonas ramus TaxID=690164 RepID=A0A917V845_9HYPH|nr:DUF805 domain-containing protein [Salinarimonas ramus]GGK48040.1 DUF805 domain-containing protein [Salinarimonas ramus]